MTNLCGSCGKKASLWNSVIGYGFVLERFHEHPAWANEKVPGEFTLVATKRPAR